MNKKRKLSQTTVIGLTIAGLVFFAALGYFALISPQRAEATRLEEEIAMTQAQIAQIRALTIQARNRERIRVADLFRLTKAMPDHTDMAGVILELNRIATETGIQFETITPDAPVPGDAFTAVPIKVVFEGHFYDLADFLFRLRNLVSVRAGELDADGRLFGVDLVTFDRGEQGFPQIRASLTISAYVFAAAPPPAAPLPAPTGTNSETTTTPPAEAEPPAAPPATPPPSGATATGATP
jgi:hypothetical protein